MVFSRFTTVQISPTINSRTFSSSQKETPYQLILCPLPPAPGNYRPAVCLHWFTCQDIPRRGDHTVRSLPRLASLTQQHVFTVHPTAARVQDCTPFQGRIIFYRIKGPRFVDPSSSVDGWVCHLAATCEWRCRICSQSSCHSAAGAWGPGGPAVCAQLAPWAA